MEFKLYRILRFRVAFSLLQYLAPRRKADIYMGVFYHQVIQ